MINFDEFMLAGLISFAVFSLCDFLATLCEGALSKIYCNKILEDGVILYEYEPLINGCLVCLSIREYEGRQYIVVVFEKGKPKVLCRLH